MKAVLLFITAIAFIINANGVRHFCDEVKEVTAQTRYADSPEIYIPDSATVFTLSGLNFNLYNYMPEQLQGRFARVPYKMVKINYPASLAHNSITKGVEELDAALKATPGQKIVLAHSQGVQVCSRWMREHANDPTAPPPGELLFILTGNPLRSTGGGNIIGKKEVDGKIGMPTPLSTPWYIIDIARRYDGWADWVQDESNTLAVRNARKGKLTLHPHYEDIDLNDTTLTIWEKGNTTYVLTREKVPPVLAGKSNTAEELKSTRDKIESAYTNRP